MNSCKEDIAPTDFSLEKTSIHDISVIVDEKEKKELKRQLDKIRIFPEPEMMEATGITLEEIAGNLESENHISGPFRGKGKIKIKSVFTDIEELQYLILKTQGEDVIYLGDVADIFNGVTDEEAEERGKKSGYFEFKLTEQGHVLVNNNQNPSQK